MKLSSTEFKSHLVQFPAQDQKNQKKLTTKQCFIFSEMELSSSNIKKFLYFLKRKLFLCFLKKKAFLVFPEVEPWIFQPKP